MLGQRSSSAGTMRKRKPVSTEWTDALELAPAYVVVDRNPTVVDKTPEKRLVWAVLDAAYDDLTAWRKPGRVMSEKYCALIKNACTWVERLDQTPWSFEWVCWQIGFSASAARIALRQTLADARRAAKPREKRARIVRLVSPVNAA